MWALNTFYPVSLSQYVFPDFLFFCSHTLPLLPIAIPAQLGEMGSMWLRINPCLSPGSIRQKQWRQIIHSVPGKEWQKSPRSCLDRCLLRKALMAKRTEPTKGDWCHSDVGEKGAIQEGSAVVSCMHIYQERTEKMLWAVTDVSWQPHFEAWHYCCRSAKWLLHEIEEVLLHHGNIRDASCRRSLSLQMRTLADSYERL